jgi:hypothetical protein
LHILEAELIRSVLTEDKVKFWLRSFNKTDRTDEAQRQRLVDAFINAIYVFDDKLVITLNYKEGQEALTLKEIEGSNLTAYAVP